MTGLLLGHLYRKPFTPFCIADLYRNTRCASNLRLDYDDIRYSHLQNRLRPLSPKKF
jgi:hypothetical protein